MSLDDDLTDSPIVTARVETPIGVLIIMAVAETRGPTIKLSGFHIHGEDVGPGAFGRQGLIAAVVAFMKEFNDYESIEIEGAVRTSGAHKGHRPRPLRFTRAALLRHFASREP